MKRDTKGMYEKALAGKVSGFTGVNDPYEEPENPDLILETDRCDLDQTIKQLVEFLEKQFYERK